MWDYCKKIVRVCKAIAEALALTRRVYPHTVHLLKQGRGSESKPSQAKGENKRKFPEISTPSGITERSDEPCNACGGKFCAPKKCALWSHPHANKDSRTAWKDSEWGIIYKKLKKDMLPKQEMAVPAGDGRFQLQQWKKSSSSTQSDDKSKKRHKVSDIANTHVFNFVNGTSTFNPLISARDVNNGITLGTGILDSGAFGGHINNYVNQAMVDSLVANGIIASTCACNSTKVCTITGCIQNSTCVSLKIDLFNELGQHATIDTIARVVQGLPYNFIIGLTTIRRYKLATVFDSLFEELEGVSDLFSDDKNIITMGQSPTENTKAARPDVLTSTNVAESAIKLPSGRPIVASRERKVDGGLFRQLAECNRHSATPMGGNLSNSVACKCDTKHTLWCVACSTSASSQAVEDQRTYSQEVINLVECTTITDNRARAYSQRVVMPDLVRTSLASQYVNSLHSKDE
jgi:hypothetical protein